MATIKNNEIKLFIDNYYQICVIKFKNNLDTQCSFSNCELVHVFEALKMLKPNKDAPTHMPEKPIDLDSVLVNELGQFGRFQLKNILLVSLPILMSGFMSEYIFSAAAIPHR